MTTVLCVEDDPQLLRTLAANLTARHYDVSLAATGEAALHSAGEHRPDVVLVDLGLPGIGGLEVIRSLRRWTTVPIIVLSARDAELDKIAALDAGADDYVSKPFGMGELHARLRAVLRRPSGDDELPVIETDQLRLDLAAHRAWRHDIEVKLTPIEWRLVESLVRRRGQLVTGRTLLTEVWGPEFVEEGSYLRVHLAHVRRKLEPTPGRPRYFHTEPGLGYRFDLPAVDDAKNA